MTAVAMQGANLAKGHFWIRAGVEPLTLGLVDDLSSSWALGAHKLTISWEILLYV